MLLAMRDGLVVVVERHDHDDRAEDLLVHRAHAVVAAGEQRRARRRSRVSMPRVAAVDDELGALVDAVCDVGLDPVALDAGDHRTDHRVGLERVADLEGLGGLGQLAHELVVAAAVHDGPGRGGADLAAVEGPHAADAGDGLVDVGVVDHHAGALAAELEQQALHRAGAGLVDLDADRGGAGEAHHVDVVVVDERGADARPWPPVTMLTTPGGKPTSCEDLGELDDARAGPAGPASSRRCSPRRAPGRSCRPCW